jgi:hypothetical protein
MKKTKFDTALASPRTPEEITTEYQKLCVELGNALINFEVQKSTMLSKYKQLNEEMTRASKEKKEETK